MAGLSDISGGRSNYGMTDNGNRKLFDDLAARAMQVQTQEMPAQPMGFMAPPVMQDSPYAQYAYRAIPNPFGGLGVQPLTGFPSAYPLVLNGVPDSFMRWIPTLQSMMPPMQPLQWPQQKQATQKAAGAARPRGTGVVTGNPGVTNTGSPTAPNPVSVIPNMHGAFIYDEPAFPAPLEQPEGYAYTPEDWEFHLERSPLPEDYRINPVVRPMRSVTGEKIGVEPAGPSVWERIWDVMSQKTPTSNPYGM